jgi:hypothetical protein
MIMSYKSQTSRKGSSRQSPKKAHDKKSKEKKKRETAKYLYRETSEVSAEQNTEKTLAGLNRLGNQVFALSPFSQYFDDWLINLRQLVSEFESYPTVKIDDQFQKERRQIFSEAESALAELRLAESTLTQEAKALADNNHLIAETDRQYAENSRELSSKRNTEIGQLSAKVRQIEDEISALQNVKFKFYQVGDKRRAQEKLQEAEKSLIAAKNEQEIIGQNFTIEQEKMHDNYENRKQELAEVSDRLHKELEKLDTDNSITARQNACNALVQAVNTLLSKVPVSK